MVYTLLPNPFPLFETSKIGKGTGSLLLRQRNSFHGMSPAISVFSLFLFFLLCGVIKSDELQILLELNSALQSSGSDVFQSWRPGGSVCKFSGVTCNLEGSVTEIELSRRNLSGALPLDSICRLQSLEKLAFGFNYLHGAVTEDMNNCVKLRYLDLGNNFFSGSVPDISSLTGLQYLHLNNSGFSGTFPWKSIGNMTALIRLSVGDNNFDRTPFPIEVVSLYNLNWLYMSNCSIEDKIPPAIGNLTGLINLELSDNFLTGKIPSEIVKLRNLWQLVLYNNHLIGTLPVGLRNLTALEKFDASKNYLEGDLFELSFLSNLVSLQLFENKFSGEIPPEFGDFQRLTNLSLYTNQLTGSLPPSLGSWSNFDFIDVSENFLTGSIPADMCKGGTMTRLLILQNNFTGAIPDTYANCSSLLRFRVSNNSLSGIVPAGIWGLPKVNIIDVAFNQLEGPITSDIQNAGDLWKLHVGSNRLSGQLPKEIAKASSLVAIDLSDNQFSGEIPATIGELGHLGSIYLHNNKFSGPIPSAIGSCIVLSDVNLAQNSLSGKIPSSLGSLPSLNSLNLSRNELSGEIPPSLSSLRLSLLDLSNNRLTGPIPESLSIEAYNGSFAGNPGLCSVSVPYFRRCSSSSGMSSEVRTLLICFAVGLTVMLLFLTSFVYVNKNQKDKDGSLKDKSWDMKSFHLLTFSEDEILNAVAEENLIGKGGSGKVYKVALSDGKELAVKHIWNTDQNGLKESRTTTPMIGKRSEKSRQFDAEVRTLSSIRHLNVVKLYCSITSEDSSLLVYEYLPQGSLWDNLHTNQKMELDWETRYDIAVGASKGLEYLHHGCEKPVLHRDVKSSNILLDQFLKPRIADFGLAKIVQVGEGQGSTSVIAGTLGYMAPEYGYTDKVTEKSDVYSFGVVLMELVSGRRPIEAEFGENKDIVNWVSTKLKTKESVLSMVDPRIGEGYKGDAIKVLRIAIQCTARLPSRRPSMRSVVQMLEEANPTKLVGIVISKDGSTVKKKTGPES